MEQRIFISWLKQRLAEQALPGTAAHKLMMHTNRELPDRFPDDGRKSAVLLLLYPESGSYKIVLIERTKDGGHHSGQIAFPGGRMEDTDLSLWHTAVRESREEIFLNDAVEYVGAITPLYIPVSRYILYPFIGFMQHTPSLVPSDTEVADIIRVDIEQLFGNKSNMQIAIGPDMYVHSRVYNINEQVYVWGATAMVLSELEVLLNEFKSL